MPSLNSMPVKGLFDILYTFCHHMYLYIQVERNREGSRPKELFDDLIEDMEGEYEKAKVRLQF